MTILLIIVGFITALIGIIGCVLPVLPGPAISYLALIILSLAKDWEPFSATFLVIMAILAVLVSILDYVVPAGGARKYGASKAGVWGSVAGMLAGFFILPPWGIIFGAFLGAFAGELLARRAGKEALRAGWGVFVGVVFGMGVKLAFSGAVLILYVGALL